MIRKKRFEPSKRVRVSLLGLWLVALPPMSSADALSELPARWQAELVPIEEADISGAERLMQEAAAESRHEVASRLSALSAEYPEDPMLSYALTRLLATAADPALRDPERAIEIASRLVLLQPIPPHQRLLALAQAATGRFDQARETQERADAAFRASTADGNRRMRWRCPHW